MDEKTKERLNEVYEFLVYCTEDLMVTRHRANSKRNSRLLELFEYIRGENENFNIEDIHDF